MKEDEFEGKNVICNHAHDCPDMLCGHREVHKYNTDCKVICNRFIDSQCIVKDINWMLLLFCLFCNLDIDRAEIMC